MTPTNAISGIVEGTTQRHHDAMMGGGWVFLICFVAAVVISIQPTWRAKCIWWGGHFGVSYPMTAVGRISWILCFAILSLSFFLESLFGLWSDSNTRQAILVTCVVLLFAGSNYDRRYWKKHGDK